ncbi:hypothetical protein DYI42_05805 [Vannielia litorea]|nr:hypothetical protein [Vannielia litorea]
MTWNPTTGALRPVVSDLLREAYLVPVVPPADLAAILSETPGPWTESFETAPRETVAAVSKALRDLMLATPRIETEDVDISGLEPHSRLYRHVEALLGVWRKMGMALPEEIQVMRHVIGSDGRDVLEALPIVDTGEDKFAPRATTELRAALLRHHGQASESAKQLWRARQARIFSGANDGTSLALALEGLTGPVGAPRDPDGSLGVWGVRDLSEEADLAAALCRGMIDNDTKAADIAILLPGEAAYAYHLGRAFAAAGVPLSGLPAPTPRRDIAMETLLHFVLALNKPAPAMVLASLYVSPMMPWTAETGAILARETMKGRFEPVLAKAFDGKAKRLFQTLRDDRPNSAETIARKIDLLTHCLTEDEAFREETASLRTRAAQLKGLLASLDWPNWEGLLEALKPTVPDAPPPERFVEGVSVFQETALPWRGAKHLIVLGAVSGRYPRGASASPLFLDSEREAFQQATGLHLPGRGEQISLGLELFRRQFSVPSESCTFLVPRRDASGSRLATSTVLSLIARTVRNGSKTATTAIDDPEKLVRDVRSLPGDAWPCRRRTVPPTGWNPVAQLPSDGVVKLNRNLFMIRQDAEGSARRQSPSRLEKLMVSPLAWTLSEFGVDEVQWTPETYDHIIAGTLAHEVLEYLFPKDQPLPDDARLEEQVGPLLDAAIRRTAPFLSTAIWRIERQGLERDIRRDARLWRAALASIRAEVLDNEIDLMGEAHGLNLFGRADCLLRIPDGRLIIVDHKKSRTGGRRDRMQVGWDLQLGLYRAMLQRPALKDGVLSRMLENEPDITVAYHLINDSGILMNGTPVGGQGFEVIDGDISQSAIETLKMRIGEVGNGLIRLNTTEDAAYFQKTAKLTPYALKDSTLVASFLVPVSSDEGAVDD